MKKNIDVLEHISKYCEQIEETKDRFGRKFVDFANDRDYKNSICMSLIQIGELSGHLSKDFRENTKKIIPWQAIKGMRNLFAHNYNAADLSTVWATTGQDIPKLSMFCKKNITMYYFMVQDQEELIDEIVSDDFDEER